MPSKRIIGLLLICVITLGSLFWIVREKGITAEKKNTPTLSVKSTPVDTKDTDNDGLSDWEEALWKTNPNDTDSDNDGKSDGEEVAAGENPAQPGAGTIQYAQAGTRSTSQTGTSVETNTNLTSQVARTVFQRYAEQRQLGGIQEFDYNTLLGDVFEGKNGYITENLYTVANIQTIESSPEALRVYGNAFSQIITQYQELFRVQLEQYLTLSVESETISADRQVFTVLASKYGAIVNQLLALKVPRQFASKHIEAINNLASIGQSLIDMGNIENDTVRGVRGMERYISLWAAQQVIYRDIAKNFTSNGIIFSTSEAGNAWNAFQ